MKKNVLISFLSCASLTFALAACDSKEDGSGSGEGGKTADGGNDDGAEGNGDASDEGGDAGDSADEGGDDSTFIQEPDGGVNSIECDVWTQDCMEGEKCMPWSNDGSSAWNATKCSPTDGNPQAAGAECTVEGNGVSGIDNCDKGMMCWDTNEEGVGVCTEFCSGSEAEPSCSDPATECVIANDGVLVLCLPSCDPLLQDCVEGQVCYPINGVFTCAPDASGEMGAKGDPCEFVNACDSGLFCANAQGVPNCTQSGGCCTTFCETDGDDPCTDGAECTPLYEEGMAPPGLETLGGCLIPMG